MAGETDAAAAAANATPPTGDASAASAAAPAAAAAAAPTQTLEQALDAGIEAASRSEKPAAAAPASEPGKASAGKDEPAGDDKGGDKGGAAAAGDDKDGDKAGDKDDAAAAGDDKGDDDKGAGKDGDDKGAGKDGDADDKQTKQPAGDPDHVNDPIPAQVSERTKTRMTWLIDRVKTQDTIVAQQRELMTEINSTGVSPENFAITLNILRLFNSPKLEDKRVAYRALLGQASELATVLGEPIPGKDPLEGHADLQQQLREGKITDQAAYELAVTRNRAAAAQRASESNQAAQAEWNAAKAQARTDLNTLGQRLMSRDPAYAAKAPIVFAAIRDELQTLHPSQWRARFLEEYVATPAPSAAPANGAPAAGDAANGGKPAQRQPMRPNKQPAGGGGPKVPANPLEALEQGLEEAAQAGRR